MKSTKIIALIGAMCLLITACNGFEKTLNSTDYEAKYEAAMRYYNEGSYNRASQLFENMSLHYRGRENAEQVQWYYAQSLYQQKEYTMAAYEFRRYASQYPYGEHAEEASYLSAYCKYINSPDSDLDQSLTSIAIEEMESFAQRWPRSVYMPEVNRCLDDMRSKIMKKEYDIAMGYYITEQYRAAFEQMRRFVNLYPESPMRTDAMYYQLLAGYQFAKGSRESKQRERYQQVVADFDRYSAQLEGKRLESAQTIYTRSREALAALEMNNNK